MKKSTFVRLLDVVIIIIIIIISIITMMIIKGLSLLRGCLDELPKERKAMVAGDMGELKRELRDKVIMVKNVKSQKLKVKTIAGDMGELKRELRETVRILIGIHLGIFLRRHGRT